MVPVPSAASRGAVHRAGGGAFCSAPSVTAKEDSCSGAGNGAAAKLEGWGSESSKTAALRES